MYVNRFNENNVNEKPWHGGTYGVVRTPLDLGNGEKVPTKFHEGIDIKPLRRDSRGEPEDDIFPVMQGIVVHVTQNNSNYGRYVVVRHDTREGSVYTLYAHLARTHVRVGDIVGTGNSLGLLGHSGAGIDRERSHLHLEACLLLHPQYDKFHEDHKLGTNRHGIYHGWNLVGMDVAKMLRLSQDGRKFSLGDFLASEQVEYRVVVPSGGEELEITHRYPWLRRCNTGSPAANPAAGKVPPSWEISFTFAGVPVSVQPSDEHIAAPQVSWFRQDAVPLRYRTCKRVVEKDGKAELTASGRTLIALLVGGQTLTVEDENDGQEG